ncbi:MULTISPECIES: asparagine synthase (glutamine-hydrolyzing) [unclassified Ruminococcus]|uniref:asparagine synthase (glutamine-hydrolyzing) n=1 Tax=unclassified Ruminococcus TaxID=2608920 RepID=UPI00210C2B9F|nr:MULTISPECIES: asparagine synthase (glutamine-hydrolyzing) [unclassified Ruminococcus]MCQ4021898.1 asparagine synthase (glutamine-hydrolyzing) [Ruminococcus sp. zg-924]MCQ4114343.1 asparagine synthase (glutamine-hydrolyzing) [Ruminococcus sp. zg-921]
MCGIAGWLDKYEDLSERSTIIENMSSSLSSRGPDDSGVFISSGRDVCLMHRRLAVIDPKNGQQPMTRRFGGYNYTIAYNGELYNTQELKAELEALGCRFETNCDTEVLLYCYIYFGEDCVLKLNGIFAFAIWDEKKKMLFAARDRVGVKPFFFFEYTNGLIFASEIKALLKNPMVKPVVDEEGLYDIFFLGPARTPGFGIFRNVKELLPGECMSYKYNILKRRRYFTLKAQIHTDSREQTIEKCRELLSDSINRQLVSDVPLCCFLSGGLDSSIICRTASENYKKNGKGRLDTYSVDYSDNDKYFTKSLFQPNKDSDYIGVMSDYIDSIHHNVVLSNKDLYYALFDSVKSRDLMPMADVDSSLLLFCREVKKDFTVALSGECADELFGGYPWYHNEKILFKECFPWSSDSRIRRSILKKGLLAGGEEYAAQRYLDTVNHTDKLKSDSRLDSRMREMFMLNYYWFMQCLLERKDRASMYSGLEVRVPFCDYRIVEYAYNMPWELKALDGREKGILRTAFDGLMPDEIVWRKKSPYPKTHNPIYMELVSRGVLDVLSRKDSIISQLVDINGVKEIIEHPNEISSPWYGQLMRAPQILAYIIELDFWIREYGVEFNI